MHTIMYYGHREMAKEAGNKTTLETSKYNYYDS
mgnify:CR=1 FL=1